MPLQINQPTSSQKPENVQTTKGKERTAFETEFMPLVTACESLFSLIDTLTAEFALVYLGRYEWHLEAEMEIDLSQS